MTRTANDGNVTLSGVPEIPAEISGVLRPYQNTRFGLFLDWESEGEGLYISTRFANVPQIHRVDRPGGIRRQLTFEKEPIREAWRRPNRAELLYLIDVGGGEFYQLVLFDPRSGRSRMLTDGKSRNLAPVWSPDGTRLAFTSTRRDGRSNDVWVLDPDGDLDPKLVLGAPDGSGWSAIDWDPVGRRLLIEQYVSITDTRVHILDLDSGALHLIAGGDGTEAVYTPFAFDDAGSSVFLTTDRSGEFAQLARLDISDLDADGVTPPAPSASQSVDGRLRIITEAIPWNVEQVTISKDRSRLAFSVNDNGVSTVHVLDPATNVHRRLEAVPRGVAIGLKFSPDGQRLGFTLDTGTSPADPFSVDVSGGTSGEAAIRWVESEVGGLDPSRFVGANLIEFPSFDGRSVPAYFYKPTGEGPHPVIINIHGGPESQSRPLFSGVFQSWIIELGAAILDPNVRGSAGYGKSYLKLDNGMLREDSVRDIGALLDWIDRQPELDSGRVMVYGGSYGGYMVLSSLIHYGERLRCGIDIVGISDFITFLENTQDYRRDLRRVEYGDERDPEMRDFFERISPLRNAGQIRSPLFVVQGQNDPRVPVTEAEQIVERVRSNGRAVWYMNALNEGHGYARKENQDLLRDAAFLFMREHLLSGGGEG